MWAGAACLLVALAVWAEFTLTERRTAQESAVRLLTAFSTDNEATEKQAGAEAQAQSQLFQASKSARRAFLQIALQDPVDALRLKRREQSLSVSLSQMRSSDARSLFEDAILPAIHNSDDAQVLRESVEFVQRWSIAETLGAAASDSLAGELVEKMLKTEDSGAIEPLANGVTLIAGNVSPSATDGLAWKLAVRSIEEKRSAVSDARLPALLALERALGTDSAGKLATKLIDRMFAEQDPFAQRTLAMEARDPGAKVSQTVADNIADRVVERMISEANPTSLGALGIVLDSVKDVIDSAKAGELAGRLAPRIVFELGLGGSEGLFSGWSGIAKKTTSTQSEPVVTLFTGALRLPFLDSHALRRGAGAMAAINAAPSAFAPAGATFLGRMRTEPDPGKLADFGSAVAALRSKLQPSDSQEAATILARRMVSEQDASGIGPMAGALDDLDEGIGRAKAGELASMLAGRMGSERSSMALLSLAVGFVAVAQQMDTSHTDGLAAPLLARMQNEKSAPVLRTLAFSLGTIEDGVSPDRIHAAGAKLTAEMAAETDDDALRALTAGLCALKSAAGTENFEKAGSILGARLGIESDPVVLYNLAASLHALAAYIGQSRFNAPASTLVNRMIDTNNPAAVRALARSLSKIALNLSPDFAAQLATKLVARMSMEPNPELLRAYGDVLGSLPEGSLDGAQIGKLDGVFAVPDAPCQVVTRVKAGGDPSRLVRQIQNPLCSEDSWTQVVRAFDDATKGSIVHGENSAATDASDADFSQMVVADDDDESSASSAAAAPDTGIDVDFNKLSEGLDGFRAKEPIDASMLAARGVSGVFSLAGLILLLFAWKQRASAPQSS